MIYEIIFVVLVLATLSVVPLAVVYALVWLPMRYTYDNFKEDPYLIPALVVWLTCLAWEGHSIWERVSWSFDYTIN